MRVGVMYSGILDANGADYVADFLGNAVRVSGNDLVKLGTFGGPQTQDIPDGLDVVIHSSGGFHLTPELIEKFKKKTKFFVWTHNDEIPNWHPSISTFTNLVHKHFSYTKAHNWGPHVEYLPIGGDHTVYFPIKGCVKRYDIGMVGCGHPWRRQFAERVKRTFPNCSFDFTMGLTHADINLIYNSTKVVIAPMQDCDQYNPEIVFGCPCRTFDVPASGAFQLQVLRKGLEDIHDGETIRQTTLKSTRDIDSVLPVWVDRIRYFLEHEREREALAAQMHRQIMNKHLYLHRLNRMLEFV